LARIPANHLPDSFSCSSPSKPNCIFTVSTSYCALLVDRLGDIRVCEPSTRPHTPFCSIVDDAAPAVSAVLSTCVPEPQLRLPTRCCNVGKVFKPKRICGYASYTGTPA